MIIREQIRAARALLGWSAQELARRSGLHVTTVQRMESGTGPVSGNIRTIRSIEKALEDGGAGFIDDERKPGVCLREIETPVQ